MVDVEFTAGVVEGTMKPRSARDLIRLHSIAPMGGHGRRGIHVSKVSCRSDRFGGPISVRFILVLHMDDGVGTSEIPIFHLTSVVKLRNFHR